MPITVDEFKLKLGLEESEAIARGIFLETECAHVTADNQQLIRSRLAATYNVQPDELSLCVTGSAKLGFSLVSKSIDGQAYPRYRPFSAMSDIDCAVVSQSIFEKIWHELARFSHSQAYWPWRANRLGDYLVCGWLRPDHFPNQRLAYCDSWWDTFRALSAGKEFRRRKVRGALFYSELHMIRYLARAINDCKAEKI